MKKTCLICSALILMFSVNNPVQADYLKSLKIKKAYGKACKITERCDDMVYVDCNAAADGPAYYLDKDLKIIGTSGGLCMMGCSAAPEAWQNCQNKKTK
ncbi:MAG: hypothetical protein CL561_10300 [Alphaproteobacteria bacterium]|nr:hypothetical protein [Alphaproteobacteria bacterium]|tara:strand:- start:2443 stop:2739 length:297 start_codon:yes stop_codon:yes gene_type:complete